MRLFSARATPVDAANALPGREQPIAPAASHAVLGTPLVPPFPAGVESIVVGMGCFWGAERIFWQTPGVYTTAVGYAGGLTPNPTYEEVCTGRTGHAEVVLVAFDVASIALDAILRLFWEGHDPTQGMRQGNDVGSQYRSLILFADDEQQRAAESSRDAYRERLRAAGYGDITTEIAPRGPFYYAEEYHQQYLHKVGFGSEGGYCGMQPTGIACPIGLNVSLSTDDQRSLNSSQ